MFAIMPVSQKKFKVGQIMSGLASGVEHQDNKANTEDVRV